jgi:hypothetical protein
MKILIDVDSGGAEATDDPSGFADRILAEAAFKIRVNLDAQQALQEAFEHVLFDVNGNRVGFVHVDL